MAELVVSKENLTLPYNFSPITWGVFETTRVTQGTAPKPRALDAGNVRLPPSIRFQTTCSVLKFLCGVRL